MRKFMNTMGAAKLSCLALSFALGTASAAFAQEASAKVESEIVAYTITLDEEGKEQRILADVVSPGGIIEYELTYRNVSEEPLGNFIIQGGVPDATQYYSAQPLDALLATFEVSVADIGWATPPVTRYVDDGTGVLSPVAVPEEEYQALRWRLAKPITPGEEVSASYRIKVEN